MNVGSVILDAIREAGWDLDGLVTDMAGDIPPLVVYQAHKIGHRAAGETVLEWEKWVKVMAARRPEHVAWFAQHGIEVVS